MNKEFYLTQFDLACMPQIRVAILNEIQKIKDNAYATPRILDKEFKENYEQIIKSMTLFSNFINLVYNEEVRPFPVIETYLLILSSNKKEQAEKILELLWCSMSEDQKEEVLKIIEKNRKG